MWKPMHFGIRGCRKTLNNCRVFAKPERLFFSLDFKINRPPEGRFLEVWERIIRPEPEHHRGIFSGESNGNGSGHNIKMDFANIYRFRHWEWAARQMVVQHF